MKIYTKTGDLGQTGLVGGSRVSKSSLRIAAIGDVDEVGAAIGLCRTLAGKDLGPRLQRVQSCLFDLGGELASPAGAQAAHTSTSERHAAMLEREMDEMDSHLPPLRNFILAGGCELASRLHLARAVCRRAERSVVALSESEPVRPELAVFLNRLADWLFLAARKANSDAAVEDIPWSRFEL